MEPRAFHRGALLVTIALVLIAFSGLAWQRHRMREIAQLSVLTATRARSYANATEVRYSRIVDGLTRLAARGDPQIEEAAEAWRRDALYYANAFDGIKGIAWIAPDLTVQLTVPPGVWHDAVNHRAADLVWEVGDIPLWSPSYVGSRFTGYVLAWLDVPAMVESIERDIGGQFAFALRIEGETVFTSAAWADRMPEFESQRAVTLKDVATATFAIAPTRAAFQAAVSRARQTLYLALFLSVLTLFGALAAMNYRTLLGRSEVRYRHLVESSRDAIFIIDDHGRYIDVNAAACALVGFSRAELCSMSSTDLRYDVANPPANESRELWRSGGSIVLDLRHRDGHPIPVEIVVSPVGRPDGSGLILGIARDLTERNRTLNDLREALERSETLIRELYHRTKNNLQVVISMLGLQANEVGDERLSKIVAGTQHRIQSMALVHEMLLRSDSLSLIRLDSYVESLARLLAASQPPRPEPIELKFESDEVSTIIDTAMPFGMVANELISNALEHAFPNGSGGTILLRVRRETDETIVLEVEDDGVGMPGDRGDSPRDSFGMQLIRVVVEQQMQGSLEIRDTAGVYCKVVVADSLYRERV